MTFRAPVPEYQFLLNHIIGYSEISATERFSEASDDVVTAILTEAGKFCDEVMAPVNRGGDLQPAYRHGPADDPDHGRERNDVGCVPFAAAGPADEPRPDRGAGASRE